MQFDNFRTELKSYLLLNNKLLKDNELPTDNFLFWLIGFTEGDGCFSINKKNEFLFILTQGRANIGILENILHRLKLGRISRLSSRVAKLVIQKTEEIKLIVLLFNGNIVLPSRKKQFEEFFSKFSKKKKLNLLYSNNSNLPSLFNTWLLGFIEAEGCFNISFLLKSSAFRTRFYLSQKGDINLPILSRLISLFSVGFIEGHSNKDKYTFVVSGLKNVVHIYPYFDNFIDCFLGKKKESYLKFKQLNSCLLKKEHLGPKFPLLVLQSNEINSAYRKFK